MSPAHRRRRQGQPDRPARGHPGPVARRWRCRPDRAVAGYSERVRQRAQPGHAVQAGRGQGRRPDRRGAAHGRGTGARRQGVDQGQPGCAHPAVGCQGLQDARRHTRQPGTGRHPAVVPVAAAQAGQGCADARSAGHPGRGRRGRAGGFRHRHPHREPLLHRPGHRADRQEHDPGVLLRPAGHQRRRFAPRRHRQDPDHQDRCARRWDDGGRDRLRFGQGRLRCGAQGRHPRGGAEGQRLLGEAGSQGA